jgi:predicted nucleic acid-binding protein
MVLIETSAWIEFLRDTGSSVCLRVDELLGENVAICDPVRMEILAGARDDKHLNDLRRLLAGATLLATESIDYEEAASLYRVCRRGGETVRRLIDCLIATIAIRADVPILHNDADFEILGRHTALSISRPT